MKLVLVANPTARSGKNEERISAALTAFSGRGVRAELVTTEPEGRTIAKVRDLIDGSGVEVVVAMGGDGTFREVAAAVVTAKRRVRMGMLPSGTANDQGKSFGIASHPESLGENVDVVLAGEVRVIDGGLLQKKEGGKVVREDLFFDSAGFGTHPAILVGRNRDREFMAQVPVLGELYRDQAVYVGAALREVLRSYVEPTAFKAEVTADGVQSHFPKLTDLIIKATPVYAGIWVPARYGEPDDGKLDLVPLKGRTEMLTRIWRDWKELPSDLEGIDWLGLAYDGGISAASFDLELFAPDGGPVHAQIDGEEWDSGVSFAIRTLPGVLPLIVRKGWVPPWS
jgi:diacylglycerol kinase family enzyme